MPIALKRPSRAQNKRAKSVEYLEKIRAGENLPLLFSIGNRGEVYLHELGIMMNVVQTVENFARENDLTQIETLVLQIGELSSVIPRYAKACYPAAVDGTMLQNTKLKMEILPGNCLCSDCRSVFNYLDNKGICPDCGSKEWDLLGGREFQIKEIIAC